MAEFIEIKGGTHDDLKELLEQVEAGFRGGEVDGHGRVLRGFPIYAWPGDKFQA